MAQRRKQHKQTKETDWGSKASVAPAGAKKQGQKLEAMYQQHT